MVYQPRVLDAQLDHLLSIAGAVLVEGVRACGKTETGRQHSASQVRLDVDDEALDLARISPSLVLDGPTPRLVDEWQLEPRLWNHVRRTVDDRRLPGQFILAGLATPADDITRHSGAGRIMRLRLRPMTLFEVGCSSGIVSLKKLMDSDPQPNGQSPMDLPEMVDQLCRGGWPAFQDYAPDDAQQFLRSYLDDVARSDIPAADDSAIRRDPMRIRRLLRAYARHVSTPASLATIAADTAQDNAQSVNANTVRDYLSVLQRVMVVEEQPSWGPHLRSRDIIRQRAIRHFVDPSLAVAALGAGPQRLLRDPNTLGLLFESLVIRDLRVYAQALGGEVLHYRDSAGVEADAIVQLPDGRWAPVEVKLGASQVDAAASSLDKFVSKIDTGKLLKPAARLIITAGQYAYTRPDGVHVIPLACLAP